jgi:exodeoxyribonuclease VII small subunit
MTMATKKKSESTDAEPAAGPSYTQACGELDEILASIEDGSADIDELSQRVERAAELIKLCRGKLERTELRVRKVVAELQQAVDAEDGAEDQE